MNLKETLKLEAINRTKERVITKIIEKRRLPFPHSNTKNDYKQLISLKYPSPPRDIKVFP